MRTTHITIKCVAAALTLGCAFLSPSGVSAKPASKQPVTATAADGSKIEIIRYGDASAHYATTIDGSPLIEIDGKFHYATISENGNILPSSSACESTKRDKIISRLQAIADATAESRRASSVTTRSAKSSRPGLMSTTCPSKGKQKGLVILVQFSDLKFFTRFPAEYFSRQLNEEGFSDNGGTGSARDYFIQNSNGKYTPDFDVYGPITLPNRMAYYGANAGNGQDAHAVDMIIDACEALDDVIDFTQYDTNNDGKVDSVYVIYAGYGEADYGDPNTIWPHTWDISKSGNPNAGIRLDGKEIDHYACSNELDGKSGVPDGIGTFVHEFSHVLGLPDLYRTKGASGRVAYTPGEFSILDYGAYNNNGRTPPNYSTYERYALDWIDPVVMSKTEWAELPPIRSNQAYIAFTENPDEYFLFEYRLKEGFDAFIPAEGMLIWHVDFVQSVFDNNDCSNNRIHQYVDLVEADNRQTPETISGDPFPGQFMKTSFTYNSSPAFRSWGNLSPGFGIHEIEETENGTVKFLILKNGDKYPSASIGTTPDSSFRVDISGHDINVAEAEGFVTITDLYGRVIAISSDGTGITIPQSGFYIVRDNKSSTKIIIP